MKKILLSICLLTALLILALSMSSCGFGGGDSLEIEKISVEKLKDGSGATRVTIKYFDDIEAPLIFDIPMGATGEKGEIGETGNGIDRIDITNSPDGSTKTMEIFYTDVNMAPTVVQVENGTTILSAVREDVVEMQTDENGLPVEITVPYMKVTMSDGSEQMVRLPDGVQGPGIDRVLQDVDPETGNTSVIFMLENGKELTPITIKPGAPGKSIDRVVPEDWTEDGKRLGLTLKFYLEGTTQPVASVNLREGVGLGELVSEPIMVGEGDNAKKVGTRFYFEKSDGTVTPEIDVMDGISVVDVTYERQSDASTKVTVWLSDDTTRDFTIPAAVSIDKIVPIVKNNGDVDIKIYTTDGAEPVTFTIVRPASIAKIDIVSHPDAPTKYLMTVTYSDDRTEEVVFDKPIAWHRGRGEPLDSLGNNGDYYFDFANSIIYHKESGSWQEVVDMDAADPVKVVFHVDFDENEDWIYELERYTFKQFKKGDSFYTAKPPVNIPIPTKSVTEEEQEAGIVAWKFLGWATKREDLTPADGFFTNLTMIPGDLDLFPVWEAVYN